MKYLIFGLGNIGPEYELTRHNIGFLTLDYLADAYKSSDFQVKKFGFVSRLVYKDVELVCIKPTTYMNLSGRAVSHWSKTLEVGIENILVVTDDIALDFGVLRLKLKGSAGGHNGLKSIQESFETQEFARLRMGVGNNFAKGHQADYVLSRFDNQEMKALESVIERAAKAIISFCTEGKDIAMNSYN